MALQRKLQLFSERFEPPSETSIEKVMGWCTAQWKMLLFCVKTIVKESRKFELAHLKKKKKKKEKHFGRLANLWFGTFMMPFSATGCVVHHKNT